MRSISLLTSPSRNACTARSFCSLLSDPMCRLCVAPRHETPTGRCRFLVSSVGIVGCCKVSLNEADQSHYTGPALSRRHRAGRVLRGHRNTHYGLLLRSTPNDCAKPRVPLGGDGKGPGI